ncbi:MAG: SAM-dependent methyltransferase, partial [Verrucomicrobia bacterium]|nr:SAM-dependent methyltransferase [Verrucomicrobiota bacterium]
SSVQAAGLSPAVPLFVHAAKSVPLEPGPIFIADYGSSAGHNSLGPVAAAIGALRERVGPEREVWVIHTDQPTNDFGGLFQTLADDPESYLRKNSAVYASAVGRSFYEQILPSNTFSLGWSSWAVQWLSKAPVAIPDQVQVAYSHDPVVRAAFANQAAEDWRNFLVHRGRELRAGGMLVLLTMAVDDEGNFGYQPLLEALYEGIVRLTNEGFIHEREARRMVIPTVGRSREDFMAPFKENNFFAGLSMNQLELFSGEDRIWTEFCANGNAHSLAAGWAAFSRASVFPTLAGGLDCGVSDPRSLDFMNRLEAHVTERLELAPKQMSIPLARMLLVKKSGA